MFYWFVWVILRIFLNLRCSYTFTGLENIPKTGGAIILSNHRSYADPFAIGCTVSFRKLHFFAKEELFDIPLFNYLISSLNAFPVKRNLLDRRSLNYSLKLLRNGRLLLIFGEGTRNLKKDVTLLPLKGGFAFLALKAKVPVIPAHIKGTEEILSLRKLKPKVSIKFGKPIMCKNSKEFMIKAYEALENLSFL